MSVTAKFAAAIAQRDGGWFCHYCAIPLIPPDRLDLYEDEDGYLLIPEGMDYPVVDHIHAKSKGGKNVLENLVLACNKCNARKGASNYEDFKGRR